MHILIYLGILLFPLQFIALSFYTSSYDLSTIIFFAVTFFYLVSIKDENMFKKIYTILFLFLIFYIVVFFFLEISPIHRFFSSIIWVGLYLTIYLLRKNFYYDARIAMNLLIFIILISAFYSWYELLFEIKIENFNSNVKARPSSFFSEPSYAGLVFYAASFAFFNIFLTSKKLIHQLLNFLSFLFFFITGLSTLSMHIISFFLSLIFALFIFIRNKKILIKFLFLTLLVSIFVLIIFFFTNFDLYNHLLDRIEFGSLLTTKSLSLLSWLRGFDQFLYVFKNFPLTGTGPGSTGEFEFYSFSGNILYNRGVYDLTLRDAYSLFFRLGIEYGIVFLIFTCIGFFVELLKAREFFKKDNILMTQPQIFIFFFSVVCIVGSYIKEPNFARATLCIAIFFFFSIFEHKKNEK